MTNNNVSIQEIENKVDIGNVEVEEPIYTSKIRDISPEEIQEIVEATRTEVFERPIPMSSISNSLLYSGVYMVEDKPGFVMLKENELAMVLEELKKAKNLQMAQQRLVTEQNRVFLKAELDKTQKALQEALEENTRLIKQNEGLQRRVDELEYKHVEVKAADMKRIDVALQNISLEEIANNQPKRLQPKATMMLIQESNDSNAKKERFKDIVEVDKAKREDNNNDGFGDNELNTAERKETPKLGRIDQMNLTRANIIVMYLNGYSKAEIGEHLGVSHMTVYRALSISNGEVLNLFDKYKQIFIDIPFEKILKWEPVDKTKVK